MDNARRRAAPMAPEERKMAIIDSVLPLVAERGNDVTSRELAQAACVAEGTLFRAFGDKTELVGAVAIEGMRRAARPEETLKELTAIESSLSLERRLEHVLEMGRGRMAEVMRWLAVLRYPWSTDQDGSESVAAHQRVHTLRKEFIAQRESQHQALVQGIALVLAPDLDRLRVPVEVATSLIVSTIAGTHARFGPRPVVPANVLVDALVNGLACPDSAPATPRPGENS